MSTVDHIAEAAKALDEARRHATELYLDTSAAGMETTTMPVFSLLQALNAAHNALDAATECELRRPDPDAVANLERITKSGGRVDA